MWLLIIIIICRTACLCSRKDWYLLETAWYPRILSVLIDHNLKIWCSVTYSMVQSPSWEANWFAASQEIPRISRNPKVHYRTHKRPPTLSILDQPNPVHIPTSHFLEIRPNIIHPSTPRSPQRSPSLRFPQQDPITPLSSHIRATCPAHLLYVLPCVIKTVALTYKLVLQYNALPQNRGALSRKTILLSR